MTGVTTITVSWRVLQQDESTVTSSSIFEFHSIYRGFNRQRLESRGRLEEHEGTKGTTPYSLEHNTESTRDNYSQKK